MNTDELNTLLDMALRSEEHANERVCELEDALAALRKPCRDLIAYCDKNPPMGDSLWCVQEIRALVVAPVVQHVPADDTEGGAL